ncbi:MAG: hypothetical protein PHG02_10235 [Oscillospiraceae bacterium]|nr:hypothetical protein [Oscillospiraceae bacterium]
METLIKGRIGFVIAQRLSAIKDADTIIYIKNADIKEVGKHATLMQKGNLCAKLYNS